MAGDYPRRLGKYVLLKTLARGGMGEICLAASGQFGGYEKLCVIKKIIPERADEAQARRFLDEAKVVLRLSHAALVTTFDAGEADGEFFIAMELVEGKDLREVWNRCVRLQQRIPIEVALHVVRETARALGYAHDYAGLGLVHRDVAPPNILLSYTGDVKLTDFGLARSVFKQENTSPGVVMGRIAYLAPELAWGRVADARTDVYALGVILWELLTGRSFLNAAGVDPVTALALARSPRVERPSAHAPWVPAELDAVVMRALAADPDGRYQRASDFHDQLSELIAEVAPRAGAGRVAAFLRDLYGDTIGEEREERERLLAEELPRFRARHSGTLATAAAYTPVGLLPLRATPRDVAARATPARATPAWSTRAAPRADETTTAHARLWRPAIAALIVGLATAAYLALR